VHQLPASLELPMRPSYGGCKSWIELEREIDTTGTRPVLNDEEFGRKLERFHEALEAPARR